MPPLASNVADQLMVCVECGHPIAYIYKEYSRGNIRLSRCRKCRSISDKYVEFETVLLLIDMMLHSVPVYRHLLVNRPNHATHRGGRGLPRMWKLVVCFLVLDVYTRLYMTTIDRSSPGSQPDAWLPMISPFTSPEGGDGTCYATHMNIDLLHQHTSLQRVLATSRAAVYGTAQAKHKQQQQLAAQGHAQGQAGGDGCAVAAGSNYTVAVSAQEAAATPLLDDGNGSGNASAVAVDAVPVVVEEEFKCAGASCTLRVIERPARGAPAAGAAAGADGPAVGGASAPSSATTGCAALDGEVAQPVPVVEVSVLGQQNRPTAAAQSSAASSSPVPSATTTLTTPTATATVTGVFGEFGRWLSGLLSQQGQFKRLEGRVQQQQADAAAGTATAAAAATTAAGSVAAASNASGSASALLLHFTDIPEAIWKMDDLGTLITHSAVASVCEAAVYALAVMIAAVCTGVLTRSRLRVDPITKAPRVQPPRSRRSFSTPAPPAAAPPAALSAAPLPQAATGAVDPAAGSSTSSTASGGTTGSSSLRAVAIPTPDGLELVSAASDAASLPPGGSAGSSDTCHSGGADGGSGIGLQPPAATLRRSISAGNTADADAVRAHMLEVERARGTGAWAQENAAAVQQQRQQQTTAAAAALAPQPAQQPSTAVVSASPGTAIVPSLLDTRVTFPPPVLAGVGPVVSSILVKLLPMVPPALLTKYVGPLREVVDDQPPTLRELQGIGRALLIANFAKVFVTLSMVWNYPVSYLRMLTLFTLTSHATALQATTDCSVADAVTLVCGGYCGLLATRALLVAAGVVEHFTVL